MDSQDESKLRFRPKARIIRTIGDQLISGPVAAVVELVKNAYDADANNVVVSFAPPLEVHKGRITVTDDGHGMTLADIRDKWMEPATLAKVANRKSPIKNRVMMGSKGIGRFASAKLGEKMALISTCGDLGNRQSVLIPEIEWSDFSGDKYLADIAIDVETQASTGPTGTVLEVSRLNENWSAEKLSRLLLELRRLLSPFAYEDSTDKFRIFLDLSACTNDLCGFDGSSLFDEPSPEDDDEIGSNQFADLKQYQVLPFPLLTSCDYEVDGSFDALGRFSGTFINRRAGKGPEEIELVVPMGAEHESCGVVDVRLFLFDREADAIKKNMLTAGLGNLTASEARKLLDNLAGVPIYRGGFRVRPYGDSNNDWLTLDRRRVQNPSMHIGHNQITGYVTVGDRESSNLEERSSREGFEDNAAFGRLTSLISELLTKVIEPKRYQFRSQAGLSRKKSATFDEVRRLSELNRIRKMIELMPPEDQAKATKAVNQQAKLISDKIDQLEERQRVLEAKSSLGAIISEVLHEGAQPASYIAITAPRLERHFPDLFGGTGPKTLAAKEEFSKKLPIMSESGEQLSYLFRSLKPLAGGKRGPVKTFNVVNVIRSATDLFSSHNITFSLLNPDSVTDLIGYSNDLTTALVNLIGNSIHWLENSQTENPEIIIEISSDIEEAIIYIEDNGPGIKEEFVDFIFEVGFSLKSEGTGLGLNIARETLARSGASLSYHLNYQKGARFEIRFPRVKEIQ